MLKRLIKNTTTITAAEILSKVLNFLMFSILARYFSKDDFGFLTTFMTIIWMVSPLADLGISQILIREIAVEKENPQKIFNNSLIIIFFTCLFTSLFISLLSFSGDYPYRYKYLLGFSGLAVSSNVLINLVGSYFKGIERMEIQAAISSIPVLIYSISGLIFASNQNGVGTLVYLILIIYLLSAVFSLFLLHKKYIPIKLTFDHQLSRQLVKVSLPVFGIISFNGILRWSGTLFLYQFSTLNDVANYGAALKIIDTLLVIIASVSVTIFPVFSKAWERSKTETKSLFEQSLRLIIPIGLASSTGLFLLSDKILVLLFGQTYISASYLLKIMSPGLCLTFIASPIGILMMSTGYKIKKFTSILGIITLANLLLNLIYVRIYGSIAAVWIFSSISLVVFIASLIYANTHFETRFRILELALKPILACVIMGLFVYFLKNLSLFISIPAGFLIFVLMLFILGEFSKKPYPEIFQHVKILLSSFSKSKN